MAVWYVYLIRTAPGDLYTGIATDVNRRLEEHKSEPSRGAKYLRGRAPLELVYRKRIGDRGLALRVEHRLKRRSKQEKEAIVRAAPTRKSLLSRLSIEG